MRYYIIKREEEKMILRERDNIAAEQFLSTQERVSELSKKKGYEVRTEVGINNVIKFLTIIRHNDCNECYKQRALELLKGLVLVS